MTDTTMNLTLPSLKKAYAEGVLTPREVLQRIREASKDSQNPVWIHQLSEVELEPYLEKLEGTEPSSLPLWGVPFAIKDNIDLQGIPTTAACPDFSYIPEKSAFVVEQLIAAGAIPVGKTNLDQFATGLVGTRSPYPWGPCHNSLNPEYISGGSSSGSAVAVASGWVSFALGTDTAGSGRIPAALNNIIGLKPTCGLLSTSGVVPACRSLDAVSIFALTADDANTVLDAAAVHDPQDPWSRSNPFANSTRYLGCPDEFTFAVPETSQLEFFGDRESEAAFRQSVRQLEELGGKKVILDFSCLLDAARLLYEGPWITERYLAVRELLENKPESLLDVTRNIICQGRDRTAQEAFSAMYELKRYASLASSLLQQADVMVTPTAGRAYTLAEIDEEPVVNNSRLGYYTNFMNLLDMTAVSVPTVMLPKQVGFGVTLFSGKFSDKSLLGLALRVQRSSGLKLGATGLSVNDQVSLAARVPYQSIHLAVCGAHLDGLPLNWQLTERGAKLVKKTTTSADYRMYALAGGPPFRPGLVRDEGRGSQIDVEVWQLPVTEFGSFVEEIPRPLGIGKVELADGSWVTSFICEGYAVKDAKEITSLGGWRQYLSSQQQ